MTDCRHEDLVTVSPLSGDLGRDHPAARPAHPGAVRRALADLFADPAYAAAARAQHAAIVALPSAAVVLSGVTAMVAAS